MFETARAAVSTSPSAQAPQERLRVALVSGNYNYIMDGAARAQNMLVAHLIKRGHEVLVFAPTLPEPAFQHAGTVIAVPSVALPGKRGEYRLGLGLGRAARARLDAFRPDLIHIATPDYTAITALRHARRRGIPAVASFHTRFDTYARYYGFAWAERYLTHYMRWLYARCVHVYPPTPSMIEELRRAGIGRELRLWGRGVDHALFSPERRDMAWRRSLGFADGDVVVAFVGRLVLEKGIDVFAEALRLAAARNPAVRALVVGEGPEHSRFGTQLPGGVFIGHQSGEALARAYASADLFFSPSVTETAGNVVLEAMAAGLACLGADVPGTRSFVRHGETGVLSPPEAGAEGFALALLRLAEDAGLRARMGAAGRDRTLSEHQWPVVLDEVIAHYREAIGTTRHAADGTGGRAIVPSILTSR
ncbi:MAG TPA: glycosyltransferase family 1 protein [Thermohalobaculum sp.]|nr:glycosyltransferase family 1 protein [Thermohalobaculum sp.]